MALRNGKVQETLISESELGTPEVDSDLISDKDEVYRRELSMLYRKLRSYAASGRAYYKDLPDANSQRFYRAYTALHDHVDRGIEPGTDYLLNVAHFYDLDPSIPGNGYRSFVTVIHRCVMRIFVLMRHIAGFQDSYLFRGEYYGKELEAFVTSLGQLRACLYYLLKLVAYCPESRLFPDEANMSKEDYLIAEQLLVEVEGLCQESFYGRCLGFQFCDSMSGPLSMINLVLASFSDGYNHTWKMAKIASSVLGSQKYIRDPELKAQRIIEVTRNGDISFCKAFWSLAENSLMHKMPMFVCPSVAFEKVMVLQPEKFSLPLADGSGHVSIPVPCAHSGPGPVNLRIISSEYRMGQENNVSKKNLPMSDGLIIQCHGGGFVAQSSASHQIYLRHWARDTGVPILSVDYSLAPEARYPRQLEEIFYAYCWAIKNASLLGWTGKRVCLVGDSAGGTLAVAASLTAVSYGIRIPDGVLSVYGCLLVKYAPSPSRMLSLMDPLLPLGVLPKCLAAYAGGVPETDNDVEVFITEKSKPDLSLPVMVTDTLNNFDLMSNETTPIPKKSADLVENSTENFTDVVENSSVKSVLFHARKTSVTDKCEIEGESPEYLRFISCSSISGSGEGDSSEPSMRKSRTHSISRTVKTTEGGATSPGCLRIRRSSSADEDRRGSVEEPIIGSLSYMTPPQSPAISATRSRFSSTEQFARPTYAKVYAATQTSFCLQFQRTNIGNDPFMSPLLAGDELLLKMCPVYLLTCHLDPMLDDSVAFAKRLRSLGKFVHLDLLDGLPHGFLNFALLSGEAKAGSELCVRRIREILAIDQN